jgi:hypothetical protein
MNENLNEFQNISIGIIAALTEAVILQPTLYWKNARATRAPMSFNPRIIFRGTLASCMNECQMMGLQFGTTGFFQKSLTERGLCSSRQSSELLSSALGGLFPTILTCPIELVKKFTNK